MWNELPFPNLLAILVAASGLFIVSVAWLYLVMRSTRATKINLRALGVSVNIDMDKERRAGGGVL